MHVEGGGNGASRYRDDDLLLVSKKKQGTVSGGQSDRTYHVCERVSQHHAGAFLAPEELHSTPLRCTGPVAVVKSLIPRAVAIKSGCATGRNKRRCCKGRTMCNFGASGYRPSRRTGRRWRPTVGEKRGHPTRR